MIIRNNNGFALAICLALLPCLIAGILLAFSVFGFIQNDLSLKYQCRREGLNGQKQVEPLLSRLLALNTLAATLKVEYLEALAEFEAATASNNPVAYTKAIVKIRKIVEKRETLDKRQKQIIKQSNLLLSTNHSKTAARLLKSGSRISNILLKADLFGLQGKAPTLAVHPDSTDIAPTYSPLDDFENKQSLAHEWQYRISVRPPFSNFIAGNFLFKKACAVTLTKEDSRWVPKITKAKFSLKSVW